MKPKQNKEMKSRRLSTAAVLKTPKIDDVVLVVIFAGFHSIKLRRKFGAVDEERQRDEIQSHIAWWLTETPRRGSGKQVNSQNSRNRIQYSFQLAGGL